jgi:hypothetical protein
MTKRKYQGEHAGHFTDGDGYKDRSEAAHRVPANHPKSPEACMQEYPCSGETALAHRAVKDRWPIHPSMKKALVDRMAGIVSDGVDADSISAGRVMVTMEKQNQEEARQHNGYMGAGGVQINIGSNATEPAEVDFEYLQWKKQQLMGRHPTTIEHVPEEQPPLAAHLPRRRRRSHTDSHTDSIGAQVLHWMHDRTLDKPPDGPWNLTYHPVDVPCFATTTCNY